MRWFCILVVALGSLAAAAHAEQSKAPAMSAELLAQLRQGGFNIFFRHALTPNYKDAIGRDPDDPRPGDCSYQRNLSEDGIAQSRALGEAFRELGIPIGVVRASPMCRCMDTAWYAFGRYERDRNILLHGTEPKNDPPEGKVWRNVESIARIPPMPMTNSIFVSHGTVSEVFGDTYLEEGEAVVIRPDGKGGWSLVARVTADAWKE